MLASAAEVTAVERWLVPDTSQCAADTTTHPCHLTLADAVTQASAGDSIKILPSTNLYAANNVTLTKNVTIFGVETARTILTGGGNTAITVTGVTAAMDIRNLTFTDASPAIIVNNGSTNVNIKNNIFEVANSTAILVEDTSSPLILNNTFYQNATSIHSTPNTLSIVNNIFSTNALAISTNVMIDNILNNLFFQNSSNGPAGILFNAPGDPAYKGNVDDQDPQFVDAVESDITKRDFHLISTTTTSTSSGNTSFGGKNSINSVDPPDMGAYGGSGSDTIPFPVSGLSGTSASDTTVDLTWSLNKNYMVTGYNVYYNINQAGPPYSNGPVDAGNVSTFMLDVSGALSSVPTLTAPSNLTTEPVASGTLKVTWLPVTGATGYEVSYKKITDATFITLPDVTAPSVTISGLTDPTPSGVPTFYDISVRAFYQASVHAAVKSYYAPSTPPTPNPKEALEFSNDALISVGTRTFGPASTIQDFPEPIVGHPNLPNKGCFIATAAYGYYSAPQVQALRQFRDRYLMTNALGRAFAEWYYRYGPIGADFINKHSWLKPAVRVALMPAVGGALFMIHTSLPTKIVVILFIGFLPVYLLRRKFMRSGGMR